MQKCYFTLNLKLYSECLCITVLPEKPGRDCVSDWALAVLDHLQQEQQAGERDTGERLPAVLAYIGMACLHTVQGRWKDACELLDNG